MGKRTDGSDLIEQHLPLVNHVVLQVAVHFPRYVDRQELARAGALGLVEAARRRGVIRPGDVVVALLTGNGLKTPDAVRFGLILPSRLFSSVLGPIAGHFALRYVLAVAKEIGETMTLPTTTIKGLLERGTRALRALLAPAPERARPT